MLVSMFVLGPVSGALSSSDFYFEQQWGIKKIGVEPSWAVSRGAGVLIGFVDSGVKLNHPDLAAKIVPGYDFVDNDAVADDENGHGTLVAGIAAASTGNGEGIAGVAPDASIFPLRAFRADGSGESDTVATAITWAVKESIRRGAKLVLNLSFVGPPGQSAQSKALFADERVTKAINFASANGAAVVAAAGNDGEASTQFDAPSGKGIIVVGASNRSDACSSFTNYGPGLDILAPGSEILSTYWKRDTNEFTYGSASGTSAAVPFVSGALALLMSNGLSASDAVQRLIATARGPAVSCRGEQSSYKFLDVGAALPPPPTPPSPSPSPAASVAPSPPVPLKVVAKPKVEPPAAPKPPPPPAPKPPPPPAPLEVPTIVLQQSPQVTQLTPLALGLPIPRRTPARPVSPSRMAAVALFLLVGILHGAVKLSPRRFR